MSSLDRLRPSTEAIVAALAGIAAVSGSYAVTGTTPPFVASPVERFFSRVAPIELIVFAIQTFGDLGQQLNFLFAIVFVVVAIAAVARLAMYVGDRTDTPVLAPVLTGVTAWSFAAVVTARPLLALGAGVPAGLVVLGPLLARALTGREEPISSKRRRALSTIGATAGIAGVGYLSGTHRTSDAASQTPASAASDSLSNRTAGVASNATAEAAPALSSPNVDGAAIQAGLEGAAAQELDVPGVGPLISDSFYEVDINAVDPNVPADDWSLSVTGAAEETFTLSYEDVLEFPAENRFVTLRCVSDDLDGSKMDTALWTGFHVRHILERARPTSDCGCVQLHAADGYYQVFPLAAFEDSLLAYGMNGSPLPRGHGYPLRTLVPGHWGEINVKWLYEIEFLDQDADGYWEQRGWHGTGPVVPLAKLETARLQDDGTRLLGGRAYGGTRGVARVEVSTDGGDSWADARLSEPLAEVETPGEAPIDATDAWRQWAYEYESPDRSHTVIVRMVDENGDVQPSEERDPYPRGASGWVSREF